MANLKTIQFFLKECKPENEVLECLHIILGFPIESINYAIKDAPAFAQVSEHNCGYKQGFLISWNHETCDSYSIDEVGKKLAISLNTNVLVENQAAEDIYLLAKPDATLKMVAIIYIDDGIDVGD